MAKGSKPMVNNYLKNLNQNADNRVVFDTNILLYDLDCLKRFDDNDIIIPTTVIDELNGLKNNDGGDSEKAYASRTISTILKELATLNGNIRDGVPISILTTSTLLEDAEDYSNITGKLFIVDSFEAIKNYNNSKNMKDLDYINTGRLNTNDDIIIAVAKALNARLITRDNNMIIKASGSVVVEEYRADKLRVKEAYKGYRYVTLSAKRLQQFCATGVTKNKFVDIVYDEETGEELEEGSEFKLYPNEFAIIDTGSRSNLYGITKGDKVFKVDFEKLNSSPDFSVHPKNIEQKMLMYLLQDPDVLAISIVGQSGKGKTFMGIDYALTQVSKNEDISQFVYTKSMREVDKAEALGTLPGGVEDKMSETIAPLYSTLEGLYSDGKGNKALQLPNDKELENIDVTGLLQQGELLAFKLRLERELAVVPLGYLRGRTLSNKVILLDEAQNITRHMIKTLTTRITDSSKLILTGDQEQIDDNNLNKQNNGLSHFVENGKEQSFIAHLTLDITRTNQRGKLAQFGNDWL